jgi:hypothetical protein
MWRPVTSGTFISTWVDDTNSVTHHFYPPSALIPFPPYKARRPLPPLSGHEWAELAGWNREDWLAFQEYGPVGVTSDPQEGESASEWQSVLALLRAVLVQGWAQSAGSTTWMPIIRAEKVKAVVNLQAEVARRIEAGEFEVGQHIGAPALIASSMAAFLYGSAAHAVATGQRYGVCLECARLMPIHDRGRPGVWCSDRCRARTVRKQGS